METVVYLIRHSVRFNNKEMIESYKTNQSDLMKYEKIILSVVGEKRAEILSKEQELQNIDIVYTSNCVRTLQTAKYLLDRQNLKVNIDERFDERRPGKPNEKDVLNWYTKQYEEENYKYENICDKIYPWVKTELTDSHALNGKHFSKKDAPVISFLGDLNVVFAIKRAEDAYEILKDNMLPPECDIIEVYHKSCENLNRDVEFVVANTWYGGFGIVADGHHEASSVCFKHIWQVCADKLEDDLIIMIPRKDAVLFAPAGNKETVQKMIDHGEQAYEQGENKISKNLYRFSRERKELVTYEE